MTSVMRAWPHLLALDPLNRDDLEAFLVHAEATKRLAIAKQLPAVPKLGVVNLFFENSTRTKTSFELAERKLGLDIVSLALASSSTAKGESLYDTVATLLSMRMQLVVIRHASSGAADYVAKRCKAQVINAGDGTHEHPSQGLLDAFTLYEAFGSLQGKTVAIIGDIKHSRVARSNLACLPKLGVNVRLFGPHTLLDPAHVTIPNVTFARSFEHAVEGADAVMMLRIQHERMAQGLLSTLDDYTLGYGLTDERLKRLAPHAKILHPGPMNRGVEIASHAADGPQSLVLQQVDNGVFVRIAILLRLMGVSV